MIDYRLLRAEAACHPCPRLFTTVSGAHLYGFPSPDSDYDLRGVHVLSVDEALGMLPKRETVDLSGVRGGTEIDFVTHDVLKFFTLLLKRNGYVLEQLYSPLIVETSQWHDELKQIARGCITRHHSHHYLGFAATQWKLFLKEDPPRIKPLLYVYRVLLTGIHLMRTGTVEANLGSLHSEYGLAHLVPLIEAKVSGAEKGTLAERQLATYEKDYLRLIQHLEAAAAASALPETPRCQPALNDLLLRARRSI
jgi:uncharacterized protein